MFMDDCVCKIVADTEFMDASLFVVDEFGTKIL